MERIIGLNLIHCVAKFCSSRHFNNKIITKNPPSSKSNPATLMQQAFLNPLRLPSKIQTSLFGHNHRHQTALIVTTVASGSGWLLSEFPTSLFGRRQTALNVATVSRRWTMDDGRWTMDDGRWTVDGGRWTVDAYAVSLPPLGSGWLRGPSFSCTSVAIPT